MTLAVKEVFRTLQGEGQNVGTVSTFVRFAGCNLWSGRANTRERDADRHGVRCPLWCDTDFVDGHKLDESDLVAEILREESALIVFTGGEPLLQLTHTLLEALKLRRPRLRVAIETNGTVELRPIVKPLIDWVCVSPKCAPEHMAIREGDELKVVWPDYNPLNYEEVGEGFTHWFVSPQALTTVAIGRTLLSGAHTQQAIDFCYDHPRWRLSTQTHKVHNLR